ncbi:MAG: tetratricopeptide repeat protein [Bacteroidota bacterium]|nr:tetratricopeptide repeat protein [Bacteroidota bacterium]
MTGRSKRRYLIYILMIALFVGVPIRSSEDNADSLLLKLVAAKEDTTKVDILLKLVNLYIDSDVKRAESYISTALAISKQNKYEEGIANAYYMMAILYKNSDIGLCEELNEVALEHAKKTQNPQILARIYNLKALINITNKFNDKALENMRLALALEITAHQSQDSALSTLVQNIGRFYYLQKKTDLARKYYLHAVEIANNCKNKRLLTYPYMNIGIMYFQEGKSDSGFYYFTRSLEIARKTQFKRIFPEIYNELSLFYLSKKDTSSFFSYSDSAILTGTANMNYEEKLFALNNRYSVYKNQHRLKEALQYVDQYIVLKDIIYQNRLRQKTDMADLKMKFNQEQIISTQKMKRQKVLFYIFILIFLLMGLLASMLLYIYRLRNIQKQLTINNLMEKNVGLTQEVELKSRELTNSILIQGQHNNLISNVIHTLTKIQHTVPKELPNKIDDVINELRYSLKSDMWELFEKEFLGVHPEFLQNLLKAYPDLTLKEKRLCSLLRLGLNTKEISEIMHLNNESVMKARTRLRKHFNLTNIDIDLTNYLSRF